MYRCPVCPDAVDRIRGGADAPHLSGEVRFYQECGEVLVVADISGIPFCAGTGFFALHIHEGSSCGGDGFARAGGHYNPKETVHPSHAGDLPPLMQYRDRAFLAVRTDRFCVQEVVGKTVVIHNEPDDFRSQPAGNAGKKIACGVICGM
ncbi:MAG: superoxide dismutase family protein [Oscillospiraceae bacterium]|nr:superoxide dismutase family protein [Oscillospiraceae bacterium]